MGAGSGAAPLMYKCFFFATLNYVSRLVILVLGFVTLNAVDLGVK